MTSPDDIKSQIDELQEKLTEVQAHELREQQFALEANERFEKNWVCLQKYYPEIVEALSNYELKEGFCIHVTKSGHGNFVPNGFSTPLYSQDPIKQAKEQVQKQTHNPAFSLTDYTGYPDNEVDTRLHSSYMAKLGRHMRKVRDYQKSKLTKLPDTFPSGIIFGIGLGYHVTELLKETTFDYLFLIEPDFEQFYASLFCTDWYQLIEKIDKQGNCLFFHLGVDKNNFINDLEHLVEEVGAFSAVRSFCFQHTPDSKINELISDWGREYFRFQMGHGFFNDAITGLAHSISHLEKDQSFLTNKKRLPEPLLELPVFVVGNGPSLDEAIDYLIDNQNKGIVVAAGSALASLEKVGVQADFHVLVERPYANYKIVEDSLPKEVYQKVNLLAVNMVHPATNDLYKWTGLALKGNEAGSDLINSLMLVKNGKMLPYIPYCNPLVANTALSFFLNFGFKNVYLFGVDNGSLPSGKHHSTHSFYKKSESDQEGIACAPVTQSKLKGNLGNSFVFTNDLYKISRSQLEKLIAHYPKRDVFNVGNGAWIEGAHPLASGELIDHQYDIDKPILVEAIKKSYFERLAMTNLSESDYQVHRFTEACEHLLEIMDESFSSISEASAILKRQQRYVYSFKNTVLGHIFHLLKGSLLYYHCPMITLLYSYEDTDFTLEKFNELFELWKQYIIDMKLYFAENYKKFCDYLNPEQIAALEK